MLGVCAANADSALKTPAAKDKAREIGVSDEDQKDRMSGLIKKLERREEAFIEELAEELRGLKITAEPFGIIKSIGGKAW